MIELVEIPSYLSSRPLQRKTEIIEKIETKMNVKRLVGWCCILFLSMTIFGYCLTLISASSLPMIKNYYKIEESTQTTLSMLNGIMPIGGILGACLAPYVLNITRKKFNFYMFAVGFTVSSLLSIIPIMEMLLLGRFLLGVFCSFSMGLSLTFMLEFSPPLIRPQLGALYTVFRTIGILLTFGFGYAFDYTRDEIQHVFVFMGPAFIAILQAVFIAIFIPHSPVQLISRYSIDQAEQSLAKIYSFSDINMVIERLKLQFLPLLIKKNPEEINKKDLSIKDSKFAFFIAMNTALLRQFCGLTYIVVYTKNIIQQTRPQEAQITPVIANSVYLVAGLLGIPLVSKFGRRPLLILGTIFLLGFNLLIGISDQVQTTLLTLISLIIYMIPCGMLVTSIVWVYPCQIIAMPKVRYTAMISWLGSALVTVIPPYITADTPNNGAYPIFYFFAAYLFVCVFLNYFFLIESKPITAKPSSQEIKHEILP